MDTRRRDLAETHIPRARNEGICTIHAVCPSPESGSGQSRSRPHRCKGSGHRGGRIGAPTSPDRSIWHPTGRGTGWPRGVRPLMSPTPVKNTRPGCQDGLRARIGGIWRLRSRPPMPHLPGDLDPVTQSRPDHHGHRRAVRCPTPCRAPPPGRPDATVACCPGAVPALLVPPICREVLVQPGEFRPSRACGNGLKPWASRARGAVNEHLVLGRCWVGVTYLGRRQSGGAGTTRPAHDRRETSFDDQSYGRRPRIGFPSLDRESE